MGFQIALGVEWDGSDDVMAYDMQMHSKSRTSKDIIHKSLRIVRYDFSRRIMKFKTRRKTYSWLEDV